jgi:hypothetical protein
LTTGSLEANHAFVENTGLVDAIGKQRELVPQHEQHWFDIYGSRPDTGELSKARPARWAAVDRVCVPGRQSGITRSGCDVHDVAQRKRAEWRMIWRPRPMKPH